MFIHASGHFFILPMFIRFSDFISKCPFAHIIDIFIVYMCMWTLFLIFLICLNSTIILHTCQYTFIKLISLFCVFSYIFSNVSYIYPTYISGSSFSLNVSLLSIILRYFLCSAICLIFLVFLIYV